MNTGKFSLQTKKMIWLDVVRNGSVKIPIQTRDFDFV